MVALQGLLDRRTSRETHRSRVAQRRCRLERQQVVLRVQEQQHNRSDTGIRAGRIWHATGTIELLQLRCRRGVRHRSRQWQSAQERLETLVEPAAQLLIEAGAGVPPGTSLRSGKRERLRLRGKMCLRAGLQQLGKLARQLLRVWPLVVVYQPLGVQVQHGTPCGLGTAAFRVLIARRPRKRLVCHVMWGILSLLLLLLLLLLQGNAAQLIDQVRGWFRCRATAPQSDAGALAARCIVP
ncbi:hypothetical protein CYME_CMD158C [Cyanidioschyzon merolae strain 10D]|uniref:Uncharacterized protein n=1 Tax=Cyanidioschyzon merolae (strain NIES-3377 / 10D) TaxID=280699 RepID=M1V4A9_CYAM1|nr:hypothetical protein CYME_CMD158C [Cyanidioschyzon merolae strain 10D]BAM79220.1 hypothetical protein CYME_CMD158C [Cyanidioschyzon merolae strain 10D]|eukprot:XP_005535506.1 hypothetical protein CYME_CMD158C [Cyanidioschyzon merolae strain 10D]